VALDGPAEVWEPTDEKLSAVYDAIPNAVGVSGVHRVWRVLASSPSFLQAVWPAVSGDLESEELERTATELREAAFIAEAVGMPSHKAFRGDLVRAEIDAEFRGQIERFNDASQAGLSRLLVLATAMQQGVEGKTSAPPSSRRAAVRATFLGFSVPPLKPAEATGKARELLDRIIAEHALPFLDDYYLSIARAPEFLSAAWNAIRPLVGDRAYVDRARRLTAMAASETSRLGTPGEAAADISGISQLEAGRIRELLHQFTAIVIPQTLIDVTLIKALTSGPDRAFRFDS
jgi:hypothetical protein